MHQRDGGDFKLREERLRTVLPARVRCSSGWSDACILNVSSRGLMIYSKAGAQPGSFIELRRGGQFVVARVVWKKNQRIGLHSPDELPIGRLICSDGATAAAQIIAIGFEVERSRQPRITDRSRGRARLFEFMALIIAGAALGSVSAFYVEQTLSKPVSAVSHALLAH